jgi:hypothetical protein
MKPLKLISLNDATIRREKAREDDCSREPSIHERTKALKTLNPMSVTE